MPLRFNDPQGAVQQIRRHAASLGAIVLDPIPSRAGLIARTTDVHVVRASRLRHGVERVRPDPDAIHEEGTMVIDGGDGELLAR
jgi:hypothetical protein